MSLAASSTNPASDVENRPQRTTPIRVLLVDDHALFREGLKEILKHDSDFEVVGEAVDGVQAVEVAKQVNPDVVVMDLIMPKKDGVEASRDILQAVPNTRILVVTASMADDAVISALAAGASGYLQKFSPREELLDTMRKVVEGRSQVSVNILHRALGSENLTAARSKPSGGTLTAREREVLTHFARGNSYAQVAEIMGKSSVTIRSTIYRIEEKLGVGTKQEIVVWAALNGLLDDHLSVPEAPKTD